MKKIKTSLIIRKVPPQTYADFYMTKQWITMDQKTSNLQYLQAIIQAIKEQMVKPVEQQPTNMDERLMEALARASEIMQKTQKPQKQTHRKPRQQKPGKKKQHWWQRD